MTALREALKAAGIESPIERLAAIAVGVLRDPASWDAAGGTSDDPGRLSKLREIGMEAARANRRNYEGARDAVYKAVRNDAALLWALFEPYRSMATDRLLRQAYELLAVQERRVVDLAASAREGGQLAVGAQGSGAPFATIPAQPGGRGDQDETDTHRRRVTTAKNPSEEGGGGHTLIETHCARAPVKDAGESRRSEPAIQGAEPTGLVPAAPTTRQAAIAAVAARISSLDRVTIDGMPLRKMSVRDAREWAAINGRKSRFIDLVTSNMPGNWIIGDHCPDDLADELWQRAEVEHAA